MRDDSRLYNPEGFAAVIAHRLSLNHLRRKPPLPLESEESASQTNPSPLDESSSTGVSTDVVHAAEEEIVYVLDSKIVPYSIIQSIPSSKIDSMKVVKDKENPVFQKFAKEYKTPANREPKCVIFINTK